MFVELHVIFVKKRNMDANNIPRPCSMPPPAPAPAPGVVAVAAAGRPGDNCRQVQDGCLIRYKNDQDALNVKLFTFGLVYVLINAGFMSLFVLTWAMLAGVVYYFQNK